MSKLILMSAILAMPIIAALAARDPVPRRGMKRAVWAFVAFNLIYSALLLWLYPRFSGF